MSAYVASPLTSLSAAHATWPPSLAKLPIPPPYIRAARPHHFQTDEQSFLSWAPRMAGDEAPAPPAVELTLGLPSFSRHQHHSFRRREARMKHYMRRAKFAAGDRRSFLSTASAIPVMPMQYAYPAVALRYMPCGLAPYVVPCWAASAVGPVVEAGMKEAAPAALENEGAEDAKSSSEFLQFSGKEKATALTRGGSSSMSNEAMAEKLEESTLKKKKKELDEEMPYVTAKGDGPEGKMITGFLYRYTEAEVSTLATTLTRGGSSNMSNEAMAEKLEESSLKKKEMEEEMPYVTTKGDGPEGKTITGFLYRYTKAEVSIMCVCHGISFSPAEFLRHAGNSHTSMPLRQIIVLPSPARNL